MKIIPVGANRAIHRVVPGTACQTQGLESQAGRRGTADQILLVRADDHFERMPGRHVMFLEGFDHLDGRHRAHTAIKIAPVRHGIDVRTKKNA